MSTFFRRRHLAWVLIALALPVQAAPSERIVWNVETAEHLINRAGFGARPAEIQEAVALGRPEFVEQLLAGERFVEEPFYARLRTKRYLGNVGSDEMSEEEKLALRRKMREADNEQLDDFVQWWLERMLAGRDPLRERMTLFWHGFFTSSHLDVRNSHEMILQNQFLRKNALGDFGVLLHGIARDPAMLEYLDNGTNKKGSPNENFARELLELFTLGEGNYTEQDVKEATRAFTGWTDSNGRFRFRRGQHDRGKKKFLGVKGRLNGDDVIDILLAQESCARHLAGRLLVYFEGQEPKEGRLEDYAAFLLETDYDLTGFLRKLFSDPAFFRPDARGTRIASPVDYLVGTSRRLGIEPPTAFLMAAAATLGEKLFFPPNVKGWEGGRTWITTSSLMQRGSYAGLLLGRYRASDLIDYDPTTDPMLAMGEGESGAGAMMDARGMVDMRQVKQLSRMKWRPRIRLVGLVAQDGAETDGEIVELLLDQLLAVPVEIDTRRGLIEFLSEERAALGLEAQGLIEQPFQAEALLRRLAHLVLSLPEAQLH